MKWAVTGAVRYPPTAPGDSATVMVGLRVSTLMPVSVNVPTLPARSVATPLADPFRRSPSTAGAVRLPGATPDSESVAANVTVTGDADHPLEFAIGDRVAVTTGGVLSMFSVTLAEALLPALSRAVPEITC